MAQCWLWMSVLLFGAVQGEHTVGPWPFLRHFILYVQLSQYTTQLFQKCSRVLGCCNGEEFLSHHFKKFSQKDINSFQLSHKWLNVGFGCVSCYLGQFKVNLYQGHGLLDLNFHLCQSLIFGQANASFYYILVFLSITEDMTKIRIFNFAATFFFAHIPL